MILLVQSPGLLTTVQDLGRPGHGVDGVSRAGAADSLALRVGNRLVGNPENTPALEMTLLGATLLFPEGATVVLTGAAPAHHPINEPIRLAPGESFAVGPLVTGARCYLCVCGGLAGAKTAGSASVHLPSGLGGAPLRKGEQIPIGRAEYEPNGKRVPAALAIYRKSIRVTRGPQADLFDSKRFYSGEYQVTQDSNRMGIRLAGPAIVAEHNSQMRTEGVPLGAIQVPANGQPIVLFVDQQTTGGYPKIANVITADLPSLGQLRPGDRVRFEQVSPVEARRQLLEQETLIQSL